MVRKLPSTSWISSSDDRKPRRQQLNVRNLKIYHIPELELETEEIALSPCDSISDISSSPPDLIPDNFRRKSLATFTVNLKSRPNSDEPTHRRSHSSSSPGDDEPLFPSSPRSSLFRVNPPSSPLFKANPPASPSLFKTNTPSSPSLSRFSFKKTPPTPSLQFIELDFYRPYYEATVPLEFPSSCLNKKEEMTAAHLFWLLNRIKESIIHGTPITAKLYLPKELWHHSQIIPNLPSKIQQLQRLTEHLSLMSKANLNELSQVRSLLNEFDTISQSIHLTRNQVHKPLSAIMKNILHPTPKSPAIEDYKNILLSFITHCSTLEAWYYHFLWSSSPTPLTPSIQHGLYRATLFITHTILTSIMSDIHQLLDSYLTQLTSDLHL